MPLSWDAWSSDSDPGGHCSHHHWRSGFRTMRLVHLRSMVQLVLVYLHNCGWLSQSVSIHFIISKRLYPSIITSISHLFVHPCPLPNPRLTRSSSYRRSAYTSYVLSVTAHGVSHVSYRSPDWQAVSHPVFCREGRYFDCTWTFCVDYAFNSHRDKPGVELFNSVCVYSLEAQRDFLPK